MSSPMHVTFKPSRYTYMGINYAYIEPTNTFMVLKLCFNVYFALYIVHCAPCVHTTFKVSRYTFMGINYAYIDPTNTFLVLNICFNIKQYFSPVKLKKYLFFIFLFFRLKIYVFNVPSSSAAGPTLNTAN